MHIKVEYPEAVINIREIKACIDAGDTIGEILERHLEEIDQDIVTPLAGVWIEILHRIHHKGRYWSLPLRECGLKCQ